MVEELENKPTMEIMKTIVEGDYLTDEDKALVEANGLLCDFAARGESSASSGVTKESVVFVAGCWVSDFPSAPLDPSYLSRRLVGSHCLQDCQGS